MATALKVKDLCKTYIVNKRQNNILKNYNIKNMEDLNVKQYLEIQEKLNKWKNKE